ncbi:MAG: hypothetical protein FWF12_12725, partial [Betaproteobacteria bacterium]|nr:hypothetical protein [Betaproteobacteria bacterium]
VALVLTLMLALTPTLAPAVAGEPDFDPGTLYATLLEEVFEAGRLVQGSVTLQVNDAAFLEEAVGKELAGTLSELIGALELRFSAVDDYDQKLYSLTFLVAGQEVAGFRVREDAQSLRITSNLLPGMTLSMPAGSAAGQGLLDNEDIMLLVSAAYLLYFGRIAAWVSDTEEETEDLYVHEFVDDSQDTDARDAYDRIQHSRVRSEHLKPLLRDLADTFYADNESQQAVANLLEPLGVTRADVRRWADELPLLIAHQLAVTDAATDFSFYYDDDGTVVGFEGVMPRLLEPFFFDQATLTYNRKTGMDDVRHTAHGDIQFGEGRALAGDLYITYGEIIDDTRRDEVAVGFAYSDSAANGGFRLLVTQQDLYLAQRDLDTLDTRLTVDVIVAEGGDEEGLRMEMTAHGETRPVGGLDFAHSTVVDIDFGGAMSITARYDIASSAYVPVPWADAGEVYDLSDLTEEQMGTVTAALSAASFRALMFFLAAVPAELYQALMFGN